MRRLLSLIAFSIALAPAAASAQDDDAASADAPSEAQPTRAVGTVEEGQPRYLAAMQRELEGMRLRNSRCEATDAQRARCSFVARGITTGRDFPVHLVYSDRTDTVYLYVESYLTVPPDGDTTPAVLRRLMELNWMVLLGKFEWDSSDGEVRLAMVLNTDSNFDRRAFRSAVRGIGQLADRYYGELDRLARGASSTPAE